MALRTGEADAAGFTAVRLASGAVALIVISYFFNKGSSKNALNGTWTSAFFLFAYAICFSFAYVGLTAATGALILFGSVQFTMIVVALYRGERLGVLEWVGLVVALGGNAISAPGKKIPTVPMIQPINVSGAPQYFRAIPPAKVANEKEGPGKA